MEHRIIAIDQSTQSTKGFIFKENGEILARASKSHKQLYPQPGFVEHDPEEIYRNTIEVIKELISNISTPPHKKLSIYILFDYHKPERNSCCLEQAQW